MTEAYLNRLATAVLSFDRVYSSISAELPSCVNYVLNGRRAEDCLHWAVPPDGTLSWVPWRTVAEMPRELPAQSPDVLRRPGNLSSAAIFVLKEITQPDPPPVAAVTWRAGRALTVESMLFEAAGR